jgi:excisionase family DNA binding protein
MAKKKAVSDNDFLTTDDVAELLFVSDRTIRNWLRDKNMPSINDERGRRFRWSDVLPWYVRMKAEEGGNDGKKDTPSPIPVDRPETEPPIRTENFDQALCRKTIAEADLKELELATKRGEVVSIADAARTMDDTAKNLQVAVLGWPTLMIGEIYGIRDRNRLFDVLTRSARELCRKLAAGGTPESPGG